MVQRDSDTAQDLGIIHVMLVLHAYRIKDSWDYGDFHPNLKGMLKSLGKGWQGQDPCRSPEWMMGKLKV
jgi:hypothetical protein